MCATTLKRFCPVSLGDWLKVCQAAGVPFVPAEQVSVIRREDYLNWTDEGAVRERLMTAYSQISEAADDNYMMRYDCCSSTEVKAALAHGKPEWSDDFCFLMIDDPRVYTIVEEYPREVVPIWKRPWIDAAKVAGYPVEYRAFVRDGAVVGVSNYYPQRQLPYNEAHLREVVRYAEVLAAALTGTPFEWHSGMAFYNGRDELDLSGVHFSADFIVSVSEEVSFLEGGPPHELGAHECCFNEDDIEGIALTDGEYYSRLEPETFLALQETTQCLVDAAMLADEHVIRYGGAFSEALYNDQEMEAHRDESYEDILRAEGEID
ncbi:MAG: hypothetical protein OXD31_17400 [Chloroflexi bacterium]|nr:hypothetical protein [Chloroflexota bacterium]